MQSITKQRAFAHFPSMPDLEHRVQQFSQYLHNTHILQQPTPIEHRTTSRRADERVEYNRVEHRKILQHNVTQRGITNRKDASKHHEGAILPPPPIPSSESIQAPTHFTPTHHRCARRLLAHGTESSGEGQSGGAGRGRGSPLTRGPCGGSDRTRRPAGGASCSGAGSCCEPCIGTAHAGHARSHAHTGYTRVTRRLRVFTRVTRVVQHTIYQTAYDSRHGD